MADELELTKPPTEPKSKKIVDEVVYRQNYMGLGVSLSYCLWDSGIITVGSSNPTIIRPESQKNIENQLAEIKERYQFELQSSLESPIELLKSLDIYLKNPQDESLPQGIKPLLEQLRRRIEFQIIKAELEKQNAGK